MNRPKLAVDIDAAGGLELFLDQARDRYREAREITIGETAAAAYACRVSRPTMRSYRVKAREGVEPFAAVVGELDAIEWEIRKAKVPPLVEAIKAANPEKAFRILFPQLAAESDRDFSSAKMEAWVVEYLEEFQEQMRDEMAARASEEAEELTAEQWLQVFYSALDDVVAKHDREASA